MKRSSEGGYAKREKGKRTGVKNLKIIKNRQHSSTKFLPMQLPHLPALLD
jgi:hypothetical protein